MRKLIAWVFMYSLDGLLADEAPSTGGSASACPSTRQTEEDRRYQSAYAHIMGRAAYEGMAGALPTADHPFTPS